MDLAPGPEIAIRSRSPGARRKYIESTEHAAQAPDHEQLAVLERCVAWLEVYQVSSLVWEFAHNHDIRSLRELRSRSADVDAHVRASFPDLSVVALRFQSVLSDVADPATQPEWPNIEWSQIIRTFDAVVAECPIGALERIGRSLRQPALSHRARTALDALRGFVRRHDPSQAEIMRIVGEQFRRGHIQVQEAAKLLALPVSDAVFELEHCGYYRSDEMIRLDQPRRDAVLARLRRRRLDGRGASASRDQELIDRDVIASERIEGVDARTWIRKR